MGEKKSSDVRSLNIYQKLAEITGKIGVIDKGGKNTEQNYAFIEYAAVAGKLRTLFAEYGVLIIPRMPKSADHQREEITTKYGNKGVAILIDFTFEIVNADKPDDKFDVTWTGEAADYGDKGTNKAATSALKYYLMRQFNISEKGEDNDEHAIDRGAVGKNAPVTPPKPRVIYASKSLIKQVQEALAEKGIEADDIDSTILSLAKVEELSKLTATNATAILQKVKNANGEALRAFVYGGDNEEGGNIPEDEGSGISAEVADPEPEEEPPLPVDDEFKEAAWGMYESLPLKAQFKLRWLKDVTGVITQKSIKTEQQWRDLMARAEAVIAGDEEIPADQRTDAGEQGKIV